MEAAPRLPMLSFDLKVCTETTHFGPQLKQYIAAFYNEDPESYITEIHNLESLRATAIRPPMDYNGVQILKKYYCQLYFLKARFPMEENQDAAVQFSWKDNQLELSHSSTDVRFELMVIMYNIGALHSYLGSADTRTNSDGMKMACTHFQCAAWAFQTVKEKYHQFIMCISLVELVHFFQQVCLSQAQECILEKSMLDNRKATIIAKVAVQVYNYYRQSLSILESAGEDMFRDKIYKEWIKFLQFKISYYKSVSLLFQGQQAEEQQKMGERVAYYQAACEQLEEAKKLANSLKHQKQEVHEGLGFTQDVVEGKRKAAKNENEFIYHESVPDKDHLQEVKGASLVKGIAFSVNDAEVSGPDIFARLVPMEAHEAASLYSEKKAQMLRQIGELIETKDQSLVEFMSSMQLDLVTKMHQATGIPQELIDRAAAISAKPTATQDLISVMGKLSNIYQEVESDLNEIEALLKEEEEAEKGYQEIMGKRPPSIIATDLAREASKYKEAHTKANDSNQTLHRAMTAHVANLKVLQQPLKQLHQQLPTVEMPNANIDERVLKDIEALVVKIEEMRNQRAMLWAQLRESVHQDDITNSLVTKQANQSLEQLFQQELQKHKQTTDLIEQNAAAQENIRRALVDTYAKAVNTRKYIQDVLQKRASTITALISSFDSYEDLVTKANKGIEFYTKLETNVSKLLQRIKSACKVQQEEREQMLSKNDIPKPQDTTTTSTPAAPKLKDYLDSRNKNSVISSYPDPNVAYPPQPVNYGVRPAPLGSEFTDIPTSNAREPHLGSMQYGYRQAPLTNSGYPNQQSLHQVDSELAKRMDTLMTNSKSDLANYYSNFSNFIPQNYSPVAYASVPVPIVTHSELGSPYDPTKAYTGTTDSYRPLSHSLNDTYTHMQYPDSSLGNTANTSGGQYPYSGTEYPQTTPTPPVTQYSQHNLNTYYPQGYAPNQSAVNPADSQNVASNKPQYHPVEYATSVPADQAKYSYHSTYSSPVPNLSSTNAGVMQYYSTNVGYFYPSSSVGGASDNSSAVSYSGATNSTVGGVQQSYAKNQNFSAGTTSFNPDSSGQGSYPANSMGYTMDQNAYAAQYPAVSSASGAANSAYWSGTQPAYPDSQGTQGYQSVNPEKPTGVTQPYPNENYTPSQYSLNQDSQSYPNQYYPAGSGTQSTQQGASSNAAAAGYATYYGQTQNVSTQSSYNPQVLQAPVAVTTIESNIDLLSGLDFSISQAPLVPQQNVAPKCVEKESKSDNSVSSVKPPTVVKEETAPTPEIKRPNVKVLPSKPLNNADVKNLFGHEWEKYEKFVETLTNKTLSGPTNLDIKWKEIQDKQDSDSQKRIVSVARCYPMKNRYPDILPYDYSRVELHGTKDDYINASFVKDVSPYAPPFIVTQSPLSSTIGDFWTMIREQQVELIFCLLGDNEIGDDIYWPREKGESLNILNMVLSLQSVIVKSHWTERLISINVPEKRDSRVVMHLQFMSWPGSLFPTTPNPFIDFTLELITLYQQQRCNTHPIVVHCSPGIGRSGLICLLTAAIFDVTNNANSIPDLAALTLKLNSCRKNILRDREHLKFSYESFLGYMKEIVSQDKMKKKMNELVPKIKEEAKQPVEPIEKNVDPLSSLDPFWASKK
ncbi:hypothetical protein JTB14_033528 [Gonioctena quinquepunctata]|nr:hypothetical protein JTB14_033528 [Gonioctena quinquepunctata]